MKKTRNISIFCLIFFIGFIFLVYVPFSRMGVENEPIKEFIFAEKSSPTPTSNPEPGASYLYGKASWYGNEYCHNKPCRTANGDWFDDSKFTCACSEDFPLGSILVVSHEERSVEVLCNDRGSFTENYRRVVDLSKAAFLELAPNSKGVIEVRVRLAE